MGTIKRVSIALTAVIMILALTACGSKSIEVPMPNGTVIEVETKEMSKEQIEALEQVATGENKLMSLMQSGVFTTDELVDLGLFAGDRIEGGMQGGFPGSRSANIDQNISSLDINDLNLDGLSEDQVNAIKSLLAGDTTIQEIVNEGILSQVQLAEIGVIQGTDQRQVPGGAKNSNRGGTNQDSSGESNTN